MTRRDIIKLLFGAAVAVTAGAQAPLSERVRRVGVLIALEANDPEGETEVEQWAGQRLLIRYGQVQL